MTGRYKSFEEFFLDLHGQVKGPRVDARANGHGRSKGGAALVEDDVILEKVRTSKSSAKLEALFDRGDITGYEGESEADWALLYVLRYWTQDPDQLARLMARSALDRPRHHERHSGAQTRIEYTIARRLDGDFKTYDWPEEFIPATEDPLPPDGGQKAFRARFTTPKQIMESATVADPWAVKPYLALGGITDLAGAAKLTGKTTLLMHMAAAIVDGRYFMGHKAKKSPVVFLSEQGNNIEKALRSAGLTDHPAIYIMLRHLAHGLTWPQIMQAAILMCEDVGAKVLMVDTLNRFTGLVGEQENQAGAVAEAMTPVLRAARDHELAVITSRHANHEGRGRGSTQFLHDVDIVLTLRSPDAALDANVRRLEAHGRYDDIPPVTNIALEKEDGREFYVNHGSSSKMQREATEAAIKDTISERNRLRLPGPTIDDLKKACGASRSTIQRAIEELGHRGALEAYGRGVKNDPVRYQLILPTEGGVPPARGQNESEDPESPIGKPDPPKSGEKDPFQASAGGQNIPDPNQTTVEDFVEHEDGTVEGAL